MLSEEEVRGMSDSSEEAVRAMERELLDMMASVLAESASLPPLDRMLSSVRVQLEAQRIMKKHMPLVERAVARDIGAAAYVNRAREELEARYGAV